MGSEESRYSTYRETKLRDIIRDKNEQVISLQSQLQGAKACIPSKKLRGGKNIEIVMKMKIGDEIGSLSSSKASSLRNAGFVCGYTMKTNGTKNNLRLIRIK